MRFTTEDLRPVSEGELDIIETVNVHSIGFWFSFVVCSKGDLIPTEKKTFFNHDKRSWGDMISAVIIPYIEYLSASSHHVLSIPLISHCVVIKLEELEYTLESYKAHCCWENGI